MAQALGTVLGGGLLFLAGKASGALNGISWESVATGLAVLVVGIALIPVGGAVPIAVLKKRAIKQLEEELRGKTGAERLRVLVPYPGGPSKPPWMYEGMEEGFRKEVMDSIEAAREAGKVEEL
ncbi:MAG TPA: hypothetical protein VN851_22920 [Thermoanaerobaculia bacterium]|nr:hypothetical protein [Thermoanaerobaculia bacterium]